MTIAELKQYRNICREIDEKNEELEDCIAFDTVTGSGTEFPFIKRSITVGGVIPGEENSRRLTELNILKRRRDSIERYVSRISDSFIKRLFEQRFIKGDRAPSWDAVAAAAGGGNSADGCRMAVKRYVEKN